MLLSESYLETGEYKKALLKNIISSTLIETGKRGEIMNHQDWLEEGGIENPTHDETIAQECQQKRIQWLCRQSVGNRILELGCNYGYILDAVCKYNKIGFGLGVDINPKNIDKALIKFPDYFFILHDIINMEHLFIDNSFNTVMLPDVLEHIPMENVLSVVIESLRIASNRVLITLPLEEKKAHCFKHRWIPDEKMVMLIFKEMMKTCEEVRVIADKDFYYLLGDIRKLHYTTEEANETARRAHEERDE